MAEQPEEVDFALAAYREEGVWQVQELAPDVTEDVEHLASALRRFPGDHGAVGLVAYDEDFFLIVRVAGPTVRLLLSDITAADEWELARTVVEQARPALPGGGRRPDARRRPRHRSATSACTPWTWACCSTTTTSTPTRCSPTSPDGWASGPRSTTWSASTNA